MRKECSKGNITKFITRLSSTVIMLITMVILSYTPKVYAGSEEYIIENGTLIKYQGNEKNVTVPDTVTEIGDFAFNRCEALTSVTLPDTVTKIGACAFSTCKNLSEIMIPDSVTSIENSAFYGCEGLKKIIIPDSVESLGSSIFSDCKNLKEIEFGVSLKSVGPFAFYNTPWLKQMKKENPLVIVNGILIDGSACKGRVVIPDTVTTIGNMAFGGFLKSCMITEAVIPSTVTVIEASAFENCKKLTRLVIPDSVTSIGEEAFDNCIGLAEIKLPKELKNIGRMAFSGCSSLKKITIPDKVSYIGKSAFSDCSALVSIKLPSSLTIIDENAFRRCRSLKSILIPNSVTTLGERAFAECGSLISVGIPGSVKNFGADAFDQTLWLLRRQSKDTYVIVNNILINGRACKGKAIIPDGVTAIEDLAFSGAAVSEVILPGSVTVIGKNAFSWCSRLGAVNIPNGVRTIEDGAFSNCSELRNISISATVAEIGKNIVSEDKKLKSIQVNALNKKYSASKTILMNRNGTVLLNYYNASGEIEIPEGVVEVAEGAFCDGFLSMIKKIKFPSSLTIIDDYIIPEFNSLEEISIPSSLVKLGKQYFTSLNSIKVYKANNKVNFIGEESALYNPDKTVLYYNLGKDDIIVPASVIEIKSFAFPNAVKSITIPESVVTFGEKLFVRQVNEAPMADEEPLYIYGYKQSSVDKYCIMNEYPGISFLALDGIYSINYILDGGVNNPDNPVSFTREKETILLKAPSKNGYKFLYWYKDISICNDGCCRGEQIVTKIPQGSLGDIELIAKWEKVN